jgi:Xaa-Pro aminopeptidase
VNGKFTERQRAIYSIVLEAGRTAASMIKPGLTYKSAHLAAAKTIANGLKNLDILKGDTEELVAEGAHALFFPHGLGHMMGLDVHDMEGLGEDFVGYDSEKRSSQFGLRSLRLAKKLQAGMVLTVEPGIYFIPMLIERWKREKKFTNYINYDVVESWLPFGGIRNEEDWLVTETGGRCLGTPFDKSPAAIEALYSELHQSI